MEKRNKDSLNLNLNKIKHSDGMSISDIQGSNSVRMEIDELKNLSPDLKSIDDPDHFEDEN